MGTLYLFTCIHYWQSIPYVSICCDMGILPMPVFRCGRLSPNSNHDTNPNFNLNPPHFANHANCNCNPEWQTRMFDKVHNNMTMCLILLWLVLVGRQLQGGPSCTCHSAALQYTYFWKGCKAEILYTTAVLFLRCLMGQYCFSRWFLLSVASVMLPAGGPTLHSGPVWLHPVRATPCI